MVVIFESGKYYLESDFTTLKSNVDVIADAVPLPSVIIDMIQSYAYSRTCNCRIRNYVFKHAYDWRPDQDYYGGTYTFQKYEYHGMITIKLCINDFPITTTYKYDVDVNN